MPRQPELRALAKSTTRNEWDWYYAHQRKSDAQHGDPARPRSEVEERVEEGSVVVQNMGRG